MDGGPGRQRPGGWCEDRGPPQRPALSSEGWECPEGVSRTAAAAWLVGWAACAGEKSFLPRTLDTASLPGGSRAEPVGRRN